MSNTIWMKELVHEIINRDKNAFREIVQHYDSKMVAVAFRFFRDWDKAKEVTHETFIKVYRKLNQYDPDRPFEPWLYRIHLNMCKSMYRKRKLRQKLFSTRLSPKDYSRYEIVTNNVLGSVMDCVNQLSWKQKTAFILMGIEEFSSREAATIMKCKESTARVHLSRAKKNLRAKLEKMGYGRE